MVVTLDYLIGINGEKFIYRHDQQFNMSVVKFETMVRVTAITGQLHESILLESFHSATIEGARTTLEMVKAGRNKKDEKMVRNIINAIDFTESAKLNENNLVEAWNIICDGVCENTSVHGNRYRSGDVFIQDAYGNIVHKPMSCERIQDSMYRLFDFYNKSPVNSIIKSIILQFYLEYVHPMCDGNGRLGRLLSLWTLTEKCGSWYNKLPISKKINENLKSYYDSFIQCEKIPVVINGEKVIDITPFISYMLNIYISAVDEQRIKQNLFTITEVQKMVLHKMSEHGVGVELSANKCSDIFGLSISESYIVLNQLTELGYLVKMEHDSYKLIVSI